MTDEKVNDMKEKEELLKNKKPITISMEEETYDQLNTAVVVDDADEMFAAGTLNRNEKALSELDQRLFENMPPTLEDTLISLEKLGERSKKTADDLLKSERSIVGDSDLMKDVKNAVKAVQDEITLQGPITYNEPMMDGLIKKYYKAINACKAYENVRNSSTKRYTAVLENHRRLLGELNDMTIARQLLKEGTISGKVNSPRELIVQANVYKLAKNCEPAEAKKREAPPQNAINSLGVYGSVLYKALSGQEGFSVILERQANSKVEGERQKGKSLARYFSYISNTLKKFEEGKVCSEIFGMVNDTITITQNSAGQLTLISNGISVPIERNAKVLSDAIDMDIVKNEKLYGTGASDDAVYSVLNETDEQVFEKRELLINYMASHTGFKVTDFLDFSSEELRRYAGMILSGGSIISKAKRKELDKLIRDSLEERIKSSDTKTITGMKTREQIRHMESLDKDEVDKKVTLKNREVKIEHNPGEEVWTKEEESIKDLIADVLYSQETWEADEKKDNPGGQLRDMLIKNQNAVAYLISDLLRPDGNRYKMIDDVLNKLPLFAMGDDAAVSEIKQKMHKQLSSITDMVETAINKTLDEQFGKDSTFNLIRKAGKLTVDGMLMDPQRLVSGWEISGKKIPGIADIIRENLDEETLSNASKSIDEAVNSSLDTIQNTVKTYSSRLFDPNKVTEYGELKLNDLTDPKLTEEQKDNLKKENVRLGNERLEQIVKDSVTGGSGQGMFIGLVFENYFSGVSMLDKRSMLGSMVRSAKPVGKLLDENKADITDEEKKSIREQNDKIRAAAIGNYLGGLLKGAGPLFQKIMQGLPAEGIPEELLGAISDMKSRLAPIPEKVVKAELLSMVERSHGQIKNITVKKSLGSASVGQTFLCEVTKADGTTEDACIKLLKPDVKSRMSREKNVLLSCARLTDQKTRAKDKLPPLKDGEKGGMERTYEGQLLRIEEEMDLTIEAGNVETGKIYDKVTNKGEEKVGAMKLNSIIAPTQSSMVLEKAPGENYQELMERIDNEVKELLKPLLKRKENGEYLDDTDEDSYIGSILNMKNEDQTGLLRGDGLKEFITQNYPPKVFKRILEVICELEKKKAYLDTFACKWVEEGIYREGFYHGDPHAGNIMVSDEKLTTIDFGNCTKLSKEQQISVTKMMFAASVGEVEDFMNEFMHLLSPESVETYNDKKDLFEKELKSLFKLGDASSAGLRIYSALLKAQELGIETPPAIYNFSQGQIRLSNSMDAMNKLIDRLKVKAGCVLHMTDYTQGYFVLADISVHEGLQDKGKYRPLAAESQYVRILLKTATTKEAFTYAVPRCVDEFEELYLSKLYSNETYGADLKKLYSEYKNAQKAVKTKQEKDKTVSGKEKDDVSKKLNAFLDVYLPIQKEKARTDTEVLKAMSEMVNDRYTEEGLTHPEVFFFEHNPYRKEDYFRLKKEYMDLVKEKGGNNVDKLNEWLDIYLDIMSKYTLECAKLAYDTNLPDDISFVDVMGEVIGKRVDETMDKLGWIKSMEYKYFKS